MQWLSIKNSLWLSSYCSTVTWSSVKCWCLIDCHCTYCTVFRRELAVLSSITQLSSQMPGIADLYSLVDCDFRKRGPHSHPPLLTLCYKMWPDMWKQDIITYLSNSCLLNIYTLHSYVYLLAKFQIHILITYGVIALQSSNNRIIDLYSEYRGNKLQVLTYTVVTYKPIELWSYNFRHCTHHEQGNGL